MRCVHEAQMHEENCFVTLTYDDEHIPEHGTLNKPDLQKFWKRLRKHTGVKFRYYACGEYGETTKRPHYHACIFGLDFADKIHFRTIGGNHLYLSETLTHVWGLGNTSVGSLTFETAAYTARYVMKKRLGEVGGEYVRIDSETGEIIPLVQPFAAMSLRPAIARRWLDKNSGDIYNGDKDYIVMRGKKLKPAKYYDKIYDNINNEHMEAIKAQRHQQRQGTTTEELRARALIARARIGQRKQI